MRTTIDQITITQKEFEKLSKVYATQKETANVDGYYNSSLPKTAWQSLIDLNAFMTLEKNSLSATLRRIKKHFNGAIFQRYNKQLLNEKGFNFDIKEFEYIEIKKLFNTANLVTNVRQYEVGNKTERKADVKNFIVEYKTIKSKDDAMFVQGSYIGLDGKKVEVEKDAFSKVLFTVKVKDKETGIEKDKYYTLLPKTSYSFWQLINSMNKIKVSKLKAEKAEKAEKAKKEKEKAEKDIVNLIEKNDNKKAKK